MSRKPDSSWITQKQKPITRQDSGSALVNYKKGDMPSRQGPSNPKKIKGNSDKWTRKQNQADYFDPSPKISASTIVTKRNIRDTAKQIEGLKKSTNKKLNTELAPQTTLKRLETLERTPKNLKPKNLKPKNLKPKSIKIKTPTQSRKQNNNLTKKLVPDLRKQADANEKKRREDWRQKQRLQREQKLLIANAADKAENAFYNFLKSEWKAKYQEPGKNAKFFMPNRKGQGTMWRHIIPHHTIGAVGIDNFIQNHVEYTNIIENLNKTIFKNAGDKGKRYYEQLKKWNTKFYAIAQRKKQEKNLSVLKNKKRAFGGPSSHRQPVTSKKTKPVSRKNVIKPPPRPQIVAPPSGNPAKTTPIGENQIVKHIPKKDKYLTATGADFRISKRQKYNEGSGEYEDFGKIILKIKSTGHVESIQEEDIPNNIKWIEIRPEIYTANTEEKYAMATIPPPKGKFTSTSGYDGINKYFFNIGSNKCFEYDNNQNGIAMRDILGKKGQRLEMRAPHISNNIWYSNPGDSAIWEQNLTGNPGYPKKGTIWDNSPIQGHDVEKKQRKKILENTVNQIKKNGYSNFITFFSPQTNYKFGFLDLNKKVAMGNGWYMLEFINNLDEMHLREEINKGPKKKNRTPVTFFISEEDIKPPKDKENWDAWGKKRKILCEWEYRMIIIEQLTNNNKSLLVDIEKLIDFNTTERYCESGDMMRYNEYTNICGHDSLKAKEKWQEDSLKTLENIKTRDLAEFKQQINMMFIGLAMDDVIKKILENENRQGIENDIKDKINKITILKFRSGKPNAAVFPMPMKEIERIKNSVIQDIKNRVLEFFQKTEDEFNKLSEMKCLETDDCCAKTIKQVDSIMNFANSKSGAFKNIIDELKEYNVHLGPLLHMELLSKKDKDTLEGILNDLLGHRTEFLGEWKKLINSDKIKNHILKLIVGKLDSIINNRYREAEDLQWVDQSNRLVSDKWETMKYQDIQWKKNKECILNLIKKINNLNNEDFLNNKLAKHISAFEKEMKSIDESFGDVLTNYQEQHAAVLTKLENIPNMSKEQLTAHINTETIILVKEKMVEKLEKIKRIEEEERKLKEEEDGKKRVLIKGIIKASLKADEIYEKTADKANDYIKKKKFVDAMKIIEEGKKQKEKDDQEKAEKERQRVALDKAMVEMVKKWKEKMKEQIRIQEEEDYRNHLIKKYNEAIDNNLKIRKDIEDIIERLNNEEEQLMATQVITPEIHNILFLETCKIDDLIKAYKKDGYLMKIINESIINITNTINKAKKIVNEYSKERLVGYDENINKFVIQITDKLNMLNGWKTHLGDFNIINEIFDIVEGDKVVFHDLEAPSTTKENISEMINQLDIALGKKPQKYIEGCLSVLKDKLNEHLRELNDTTRQNTAIILENLKGIEANLGNSFVHYKELCKTFNGTDFFSDAEKKYDEIFKLLADKMELETTEITTNTTQLEQYQMMVEKEKKVEEYNNKYNEIIEDIDKNVRAQLPSALLEDIHEEKSSLFFDEEGTSGLLNRLEAIELTDIEENKKEQLEDMKKRLEIDINAKNEEFLFYKKLLVDMGFNGEEKDMKILKATNYTNLINSLQKDELSNYLCIKNLLKLKLLQWKTKAIHKEDGNTELLMRERAKTLKEDAEKEEKERKEQERLAALATIRKKKEDDIKKKRGESAIIIERFNDIQNKLNENKKRIESIKKAKEDKEKENKLRRKDDNNNYLRELFRHNRPNLKEYEKGGTTTDYTEEEVWG